MYGVFMRAVVQRVSSASVEVAGEIVGKIDEGFLVLLGVEKGDTEKDAEYLAEKIAFLRVFKDENDKMNLSLKETPDKACLVVSQFTLLGDCRKGRRPSFDSAGEPKEANRLYEYFMEQLNKIDIKTASGVFQASMKVSLCNEGPVTLLLSSRKTF